MEAPPFFCLSGDSVLEPAPKLGLSGTQIAGRAADGWGACMAAGITAGEKNKMSTVKL